MRPGDAATTAEVSRPRGPQTTSL